MLGKLMKYEFKATARWFLPMFAALVVIAVLNRILIALAQSQMLAQSPYMGIPIALVSMLFFMAIAAVGVISFIVMIQRFYKNLLGDEGYLMFTLPVSTHANLSCKLIVTMVWSIASTLLVCVIGGLFAWSLFTPDMRVEFWESYREFAGAIRDNLHMSVGMLALESAVASLLIGACSVLQVYAAIAIGHLANRYRVLLGIGAYLGLNIVKSVVSNILNIFLSTNDMFGHSGNPLYWMYNIDRITETVHTLIWIGVALQVLFGAGCYVATSLILSKKLNLE